MGTWRVRSMATTKVMLATRNRMDTAVSAIPSEPLAKRVDGVIGKLTEHEVDHELHADQRRQRERVEQEGDEAEGAGAAPDCEVERR